VIGMALVSAIEIGFRDQICGPIFWGM